MSIEKLTSDEKAQLATFKERVLPLLTKDEYKEDHFLIRWLMAREFDMDKAEAMLKNSLEWRKENDVDGILEREPLPENFRKKFMYAVVGEDEDGCPLLLLPGGRHDTRSMVEEFGADQVYKWAIVWMEQIMSHLEDARKKTGKQCFQVIEIMDFEGYSIRQMTHKPTMDYSTKMMKTFDENYPEIVKSFMIINAPRIFPIMFNIFKPLLNKHMLEKMSVYGSNDADWLAVFKQRNYPMELFPPRWGGTLKGEDEFCSTCDIWIDAPIPLRYFKEIDGEDEEGFMTVKVAPREKFKLEVEIEAKGTKLEWKFQTVMHDISFGLTFELPGAVDIPVARVNSHKEMQEGKVVCGAKGKCTFTFDNRYSLNTGKTLRYRIDLIAPTGK